MHNLLLHPAAPGRVYQENHVGTYRSDDYGDTWYAIHGGLPTDFGFGMAINPNNPKTCYVVPLEADGYAFRHTTGAFSVYQLKNSGKGWTRRQKGLPRKNAFLGVKREGMSQDILDPAGIYVGTSNGQVFNSRDEGRSWHLAVDYLPQILSVEAAVV